MLSFVKRFTLSRTCWFLLFLFALVIEGCAGYFQYGLNLKPCVECVYERAAVAAFLLCGLVGFISPEFLLTRLCAILGFLASSAWGLSVSINHYESTLSQGFGATCRLRADFPEYIKLDEWLPWFFKPLDTCGPLDWSLLSLSMPQWLVIIFGCGVAVGFVFFIAQFARLKRHNRYDSYYS